MKTKTIFISFLMMIIISSCSSFSEVHYFKDKVGLKLGEETNKVANYYKVKICGYSFLSSSRYVSGYFNQNAIDLYFNEIKQPDNAKLFTTSETNGTKSSLTNEDGNELVLVFSTNAKAITEQIGNIAKNQTILNSIAQLTQKDKINDALNVKTQLTQTDLDIQNYILNTDLYLSNLEGRSKEEIKNVIDQYLKSLIK